MIWIISPSFGEGFWDALSGYLLQLFQLGKQNGIAWNDAVMRFEYEVYVDSINWDPPLG